MRLLDCANVASAPHGRIVTPLKFLDTKGQILDDVKLTSIPIGAAEIQGIQQNR